MFFFLFVKKFSATKLRNVLLKNDQVIFQMLEASEVKIMIWKIYEPNGKFKSRYEIGVGIEKACPLPPNAARAFTGVGVHFST